MTEKKSVLVAIPTNRVKYYCLGKLLNNLPKLEGADEIVFADDTHPKDKNPLGTDTPADSYAGIIEKHGYTVLKVEETTKLLTPPRIRQRLVNTRNCLRKYFLNSNHTHMLFIDSDVIVPKDTIPRLLSENVDVMTGIYWQRNPNTGKSYIVCFRYQDKESYNVGMNDYGYPLTFNELTPSRVIGHPDGDIHITAMGFGCVMISRKVLEDERWKFRWKEDEPERKTTEDMWWSLDLKELGYDFYAHTGVLCQHFPKSWEGPI